VLHSLNNGLAKVMIFLAVGNVVLVTSTSAGDDIRGLLRRVPASGILLVVGLFAVTGSPPFGMFISEFTIISAAIGQHHAWIAAVVIGLLAIIFVGIASMILEMVYAPADAPAALGRSEERRRLVVAPAALAILVLLLGIYLPRPLTDALSSAAITLGGRAP
jgi:hydrogenase-4 component F